MKVLNIQNRLGHVFGVLLQLCSIMQVEKEEVLTDLNVRGEYTSQQKQIFSLFEKSVSFLCQAFNSTLHHRRKSILETLIDGYTKVREIMKKQPDSSNHTDNNFLLISPNQPTSSKNQNLQIKESQLQLWYWIQQKSKSDFTTPL